MKEDYNKARLLFEWLGYAAIQFEKNPGIFLHSN